MAVLAPDGTRTTDGTIIAEETIASKRAPQERGFALLIVLWTIVLIALLVMHLTATGRGEARLAGNLRSAAVMEAAADGAVSEAIFHVLDSAAGHWPADGVTHRIRLPEAVIDLTIRTEAGKLNLNTVQPPLLQALLHVRGVNTAAAASLAAAIADWRFPDSQTGQGQPKAQQYRDSGRDYGPPGEAFQTLGELRLVLGMTPAIEASIAPYVTLYHEGDPDTRDASEPVMRALRDSTGVDPQANTGPRDERVVVITATAGQPYAAGAAPAGGIRFVRRAIVRMGSRTRGDLFEILTWDALQG